MLKYTICFIKLNDEILMLNRQNPPNMGHWNGVGGKIDSGETPKECVIREVKEETGIELYENQAIYKGVTTWLSDGIRHGGMYVFLAELDKNPGLNTPVKMDEGIFDWKFVDWLLDEQNLGSGQLIPRYLPDILMDQQCYEHHFQINDKQVVSYERSVLEHANV
ncbi:NUDIX hydrolase [Aquisalibacillus elongatus]|uniref:Dihydroneopterin triphosphate pyrophosphatase n=1 Tax=Aquisalibacillus elongatus TaxID=485577 RepID=A0A3N5B734_9BACI|nr:8-oxo-dGTP diphosphatase [Aquisalibacillus elongatus]RPF53173.1 dihydroneopterin triphosphate pyrophosphatase [Aquisalibacillus elongatus]